MANFAHAATDVAFPPGFALVVPVNAIVRHKLTEARARLVVNQFLHDSIWALLASLSGLAALRWLTLSGFPSIFLLWPALLVLPFLGVLTVAALRWRSLRDVAREVDLRAGTKDRFSTELAMTGETAWHQVVHREVAEYAEGWRPGDHLKPVLPGRNFLWLLVPLLALATIEGMHRWRQAGLRDEIAQARALLDDTRRAAKAQEKNPEVAAAAKELEDALKTLPDSKEPLRDALRALAELERKLASSPAGGNALSPAEAAALADAIAAESPQLAGELRSGDHASAAESVARLDPAELARALEQAAKHLESRRLQELAEQGQNAQRQLGSILRSSPGDGSGSARKKFLSALRDIKNGTGGEQKDGENSGGEGAPNESPNGKEKPDSGLADNAPPGGAPGSDKDQGRGAPVGNEQDPNRDGGGPEEFVQGTLGDGASLVEMMRAAGGDDPAAQRAWKSAYQSAAPAALDAVAREEIPAGSRLLVKRYFEAIRPKD